MIKTITKIGNSQGLIFDSAILKASLLNRNEVTATLRKRITG